MHYIFAYHLRQQQIPAAPIVSHAVLLGSLSVALYALLYQFSNELVEMASMTRQGNKGFFLIPILLAFVFSVVHGGFTGHFWDLLGFKPKSK